MAIADLTQDQVKSLIHYNPKTGAFTWLKRSLEWFKSEHDCSVWNSNYAGKPAGSLYNGYIRLCLSNNHCLGHRVAWLYMYGEWPAHHIDHINWNRSDNRISNLRSVTPSINARNQRMPDRNTSGFVGIDRSSKNRWRVRIMTSDGRRQLGSFATMEEAVRIRDEAYQEHQYHQNHGRQA